MQKRKQLQHKRLTDTQHQPTVPPPEKIINSVYGDVSGFPPTLLMTGTRDLFLSNTVRVHRKLRQAGVQADLHVFEGPYVRACGGREGSRDMDRRLAGMCLFTME